MKCPARRLTNTGIRKVRIKNWYRMKPTTMPGTMVGDRNTDRKSCFPFIPERARA